MATRQQPSRVSPPSGGDPQADTLGRLTEILERMWRPQGEQRVMFEAPRYDGKGDVELFVRQFTDVAAANEWPRAAALLHLRRALRDGATNCGRADTVEGIFNALRARFGLTPREARARIVVLQRDFQTTLQEHGDEVERLVEVAYAEIPCDLRRSMAVDIFASTIGNGYLQRHLLAVATPTLEEAIKAGNEYLQIQTGHRAYTKQAVAMFDDGREEEEASLHSMQGATMGVTDPMTKLLEAVQALTQKVELLGQSPQQYPGPQEANTTMRCFNCDRLGHLSRHCKQPRIGRNPPQPTMIRQGPPPRAWAHPQVEHRQNLQPAGNASRPQQ